MKKFAEVCVGVAWFAAIVVWDIIAELAAKLLLFFLPKDHP